MINEVHLIGRLGKAPESRTAGDAPLTTFSIATSTSWKDKAGEWKEETEWHNIVTWRQLAERCGKLKQGQLVYVSGRLKTEKYQKDGQDHYSTKIVADTVRLLEKKEMASSDTGVNGLGHSTSDDLPF